MKIKEKIAKTINCIISKEYYIILLFLITAIIFKLVYLFASPIWRVDIFYHIQGAKTIIDGGVLFKDFGNSHPAGIVLIHLLLIKLFSYDNLLISLKATAIIFQTLSAYLIYNILKARFNKKISAGIGVIFLAAISINWELWPANIMLLYLLPMLAGLYFLTKDNFALSPLNLFFSGFLFALSTLISTNTIFYTLIIPIISFYFTRSIKKTVINSFIAILGFIIPILIQFYYLFINDAIKDWYYWSVQWSSVYTGYKPFYLRIIKFFQSLIKLWEWFPLYLIAGIGIYRILKDKIYKQNKLAYFVLAVFFISIITRMAMLRPNVRYSLYLIPGLILAVPFIDFDKIKLKNIKSKIIIIISILIISSGFVFNYYFTITYPINYNQRKELREWIIKNTSPDDKIYVWHEGYEIYYFTKRKMATSIFSAGEFLDHVDIWEANKYQYIDIPWKKFLEEFRRDMPVIVIDLRPDFKTDNNWIRSGKLKYYFDIFKKIIDDNYVYVKDINGARIWKRKY